MENEEWLKGLLNEDEAIAEFTTAESYQTGYCIVPAYIPVENLDIAGCLEETLHRILDVEDKSGVPSKSVKEDTVRRILIADKEVNEEDEDEDEIVEIDLGYRIHSHITSFTRVPLSAVGFEKKLYERFKLIWMLDHDITLSEAFRDWSMYLSDADIKTPEEVFENWENDCGFSGSLYPCFDEYLETEYQMEDMRLIFSEDEKRCWELDQPESAEENSDESV